MNFSLGGVKRVLLAATLLLSIGLAGCSDDDSSPLDDAKNSPSADPNAADKQAITDLVGDFWAAVVQAQNTGKADAKPFKGLAAPVIVEDQLSTVVRYQKLKLLRVGKPAISEVEVAITGSTAAISACKNEDGWTAEQNGEPIPNEKKFGNRPWGAEATKTDGAWMLTDIRLPPKGSKTCT